MLFNLEELLYAGVKGENFPMMSEQKLEKKFGQSSVFVASTLLEDGGTLKSASPASLLKEAIHVISCGYEDKTEWGKEVTAKFGVISSHLHLTLSFWPLNLSQPRFCCNPGWLDLWVGYGRYIDRF